MVNNGIIENDLMLKEDLQPEEAASMPIPPRCGNANHVIKQSDVLGFVVSSYQGEELEVGVDRIEHTPKLLRPVLLGQGCFTRQLSYVGLGCEHCVFCLQLLAFC